jgi:hypothetical protein
VVLEVVGWGLVVPRVQLLLDKVQCVLSVDVSVALMCILVVSSAAVGVGGIAVGLDLGAAWAGEASWARGKSLGVAGSDVVRSTGAETWRAHHNGSLDHVESRGVDWSGGVGESDVGITSSAESIVDDLTTLERVRRYIK